jgi:hypothetical protein
MALASFLWVTRAHGGLAVGVAFFAIAGALAAVGAVAAWREGAAQAVAMLFLVCVVLSVALVPLPTRYYLRPSEETLALRQIWAAIPHDAPVAEYGMGYEYLYLKMNRPVLFAQKLDDLRDFLKGPGPRYLFTRMADLEEIRRLAARPLREVGTWRLDRRTAILLATEPAPSPAGT